LGAETQQIVIHRSSFEPDVLGSRAMSTLFLVRHGQASSYDHGGDHLSDLGRAQARKLGEYLVQSAAKLDGAVAGTMLRQQQTASIVAEVYGEAGLPFPSMQVDARWNEYDAQGVTRALTPVLAAADPDFARKVQEFQAAVGTREQNRFFQRMFEVVMAKWVRDEISAPGVEAFSAFHQRVSEAREAITSDPTSRRVAVFTSGGPIGACVQTVMRAPSLVSMEINWRVRNTSITELLYSRDRISLDVFNAIPHLVDPALHSFR
jgi:broad specificity phosphatase PhoE